MAASATCTGIVNTGNGWQIEFADGGGFLFANLQEAKNQAFSIDDDVLWVRLAIIAWWLRKNPNGGNPQQLIGKTLTFDLESPNPFTIAAV